MTSDGGYFDELPPATKRAVALAGIAIMELMPKVKEASSLAIAEAQMPTGGDIVLAAGSFRSHGRQLGELAEMYQQLSDAFTGAADALEEHLEGR